MRTSNTGDTITPPARAASTFARLRSALLLVALGAVAACGGGDGAPTMPDPGETPAPSVLLKDVVIDRLPPPFYHFEYDAAGTVTRVSYASGLTLYDVIHEGGRIRELRNVAGTNRDRIVYAYGATGRADRVEYVDADGVTFTRLHFTYDGPKLVAFERERRVAAGFVVDKTVTLSYHADGNLRELTQRRPRIDGFQDEATRTDRFEQYDDGINVDGFALIHDDFFDHLVLLPGVQLQKNNPLRETRSGDGLNYTIDYALTYDDRKRPLTKRGDVTITNGTQPGTRVQTNTEFSYY